MDGISFYLENLRVAFKNKTILEVPLLAMPKEQTISIIGPNGAGKSTLIKALLGAYPCTALQLFGSDAKERLKKGEVAWVGQHELFALPLTVLDYVLLGCYPNLSWFEQPSLENKTRALALLDYFELSDFSQSRIDVLSGGEKQRAAIVRALIQDTNVLLLDEPTNHLDVRYQHQLMKYLAKSQGEQAKTIIMVLHDLTLAANYSDYIILINHGQIVAQGRPEHVMNAENLSHAYNWKISPHSLPSGAVSFDSF